MDKSNFNLQIIDSQVRLHLTSQPEIEVVATFTEICSALRRYCENNGLELPEILTRTAPV